MKKRRVQISPVPEEVYKDVAESPGQIFQFLDELQVDVPSRAEYMLLCLKTTMPKFDLRFYRTQDDYLLDYTACLLKDRDDYQFHSFRRDVEADVWDMFMPPPVIGLGIKTRLRPGIDNL